MAGLHICCGTQHTLYTSTSLRCSVRCTNRVCLYDSDQQIQEEISPPGGMQRYEQHNKSQSDQNCSCLCSGVGAKNPLSCLSLRHIHPSLSSHTFQKPTQSWSRSFRATSQAPPWRADRLPRSCSDYLKRRGGSEYLPAPLFSFIAPSAQDC